MNGRQRQNINNLIGVTPKFNTLHDVEAYIESSFYSAHFVLYYIFYYFRVHCQGGIAQLCVKVTCFDLPSL